MDGRSGYYRGPEKGARGRCGGRYLIAAGVFACRAAICMRPAVAGDGGFHESNYGIRSGHLACVRGPSRCRAAAGDLCACDQLPAINIKLGDELDEMSKITVTSFISTYLSTLDADGWRLYCLQNSNSGITWP